MNIETYDGITRAHSAAELHIKFARDELATRERIYRKNINELVKCTRRYHATGIAYATSGAQQAIGMTGLKPKEYFRRLAKELKRPFISSWSTTAYTWQAKRYVSFTSLQIPKTKSMENLVSGLLLMSAGNKSWYEHPLTHNSNERSWTFVFVGQDGRRQYMAFRKMCVTNPIARIVLNLPRE